MMIRKVVTSTPTWFHIWRGIQTGRPVFLNWQNAHAQRRVGYTPTSFDSPLSFFFVVYLVSKGRSLLLAERGKIAQVLQQRPLNSEWPTRLLFVSLRWGSLFLQLESKGIHSSSSSFKCLCFSYFFFFEDFIRHFIHSERQRMRRALWQRLNIFPGEFGSFCCSMPALQRILLWCITRTKSVTTFFYFFLFQYLLSQSRHSFVQSASCTPGG